MFASLPRSISYVESAFLWLTYLAIQTIRQIAASPPKTLNATYTHNKDSRAGNEFEGKDGTSQLLAGSAT